MSGLVPMLYQHSLLMLELCPSERFISLSLGCCGHVDTDVTVVEREYSGAALMHSFTTQSSRILPLYIYLPAMVFSYFPGYHFSLKKKNPE